jgi:heme exporter protein C
VPLNFLAVRLAQSLVHPRVFATAEGGMPGKMWLTFLVSMAGMALLWVTLVKLEMTAKNASSQLSRLRRALRGEPRPGGARIAPGIATRPH